MKNRNSVRDQLTLAMSPVQCRLYGKQLDALIEAWFRHERSGRTRRQQEVERNESLLYFLIQRARDELNAIDLLDREYAEFMQRVSNAATSRERDQHVLEFAALLDDRKHATLGDRRALRRWFGVDAVSERYHTRKAKRERALGFLLERIGVLAAAFLRTIESVTDAARAWRKLELENLLTPILGDPKAIRTRVPSFRCLSTALRALPESVQRHGVTDGSTRFIYRSAMESAQDVWLQCEALTLLARISPDSLASALRIRLTRPMPGDDLFVRRHCVRLLGKHVVDYQELADLYPLLLRDPSPSVRQCIADAMRSVAPELMQDIMRALLLNDPIPQVRAASLTVLADLISRDTFAPLLQVFDDWYGVESNDFVLRTGMHFSTTVYARVQEECGADAARACLHMLCAHLERLHRQAEKLANRRQAAQLRERLWLRSRGDAQDLLERISAKLEGVPEGGTIRLQHSETDTRSETPRVLSVLAQSDFPLELNKTWRGTRLWRGHRFGFRLWRAWYELLHPSTDKRQAFAHTIGRIFRSNTHIPSAILAELAQTKVPGEPLQISDEDGWRPYLPLVDEVISCLDQPASAGPLRIHTAEGVTEVEPPRSLLRRLRARVRLTRRFADYAEMRNWQEDSSHPANRYLEALAELHIQVRFEAHRYPETEPEWSTDPAVQRFFPAFLPLSSDEWLTRIQDYFFSVYENTVQELLVFLGLLSVWVVGRHVYLSQAMRRARRDTPLVIGGWGTRGKSGTERLKAGLFNALGHSVVSKTTGCEAMFLHAAPHGKLREMFLFRPYDKATIWEQMNVVRLARRLDTQVFLWECMGLTPSYVEILQQQWMRDDISTITNTYPDHEDLQGPAGINIPQVMTRFIPANSTLITSEEQMLPILADAARKRGTKLRSVGWLQAGLLADDVLDRFPYEEHAYNIALVQDLARELGIDADFALKEMADRVVPDLGVLKASPPAPVAGRVLEFINGMSANERFGCMANWRRMGFQDHDCAQHPGVWLTTVVNNRADRVPRSRVFADMLVRDLMADCHVLIGTNLDGLRNFIAEAWEEYAADLSPWSEGEKSPAAAVARVRAMAARMRIPLTHQQVDAELASLLQALAVEFDSAEIPLLRDDAAALRARIDGRVEDAQRLLDYVHMQVQRVRALDQLCARLAQSEAGAQGLEQEYRALLESWFQQKIVVIADDHASGEQLIAAVTAHTPPGMFNRVMGVQNIKGTGLDFVYRWQAWEQCHAACQLLVSDDQVQAEQGLKSLVPIRDFGQLCAHTVADSLERARGSRVAQSEHFQAELKVVEGNLEAAAQRLKSGPRSGQQGGWLQSLANGVEAFVDAGDAITRRKSANRIYRELAAERISHEQAAQELQTLNRRQRGGWLYQRLRGFRSRDGKNA